MPPSELSIPVTVTSWPRDNRSVDTGAGIMKAVDVVSIVAVREPSFVLIMMLPSSIFSMVPTSARPALPSWKSP